MILTRYDWRAEGACLSADPDLFFPISATGSSGSQIAQAKAVCAACTVRQECMGFALDHSDVQGIWGGTTDDERRKLRRARTRSAARGATISRRHHAA
jgi:WhiB family transcriptional regulator, redox-sensing transcriptional regulator